jgi:hypothetical protein
VVLVGFAVAEWRRTGGTPGAPLDDVYIHFQFARNLATGQGLAFNPGQPTSGSTAPLWTILLASVYPVSGNSLLLSARALSALAFLSCAVASYFVALWLLSEQWAALLVGTLIALSGRLAWAGMSGMETAPFAVVSLLGIARHERELARRRPAFASTALLGIASLLRPEGYVLYGLAVLHRWWVGWRRAEGTVQRDWLFAEAGSMALYLGLISPYLWYSYHTTGHLLPNTFRVVSGDVRYPPLRYVRAYLKLVLLDQPFVMLLVPLGLAALIRRRVGGLLWAWAVTLPAISAFVAPRLRHHGRYTMPLLPLYVVMGVMGLMVLLDWIGERFGRQTAVRWRWVLVVGPVVCVSLAVAVRWGDQFAWNVDNINDMQVALGRWAAENIPPGATLALNDIGAIGYISGRPVIDVVGLVTPEVIEVLEAQQRGDEREAALCRFLSYRAPAYAILFPNWYPILTSNAQVMRPIHRVRLAHNTISGGDEMIVYAPRWPYIEAPSIVHPVEAKLGHTAGLRGFDADLARLGDGEMLALTLYWESLAAAEISYKVFVHLVDGEGAIVAQHDGFPVEGLAPTTIWQAGDVVRDERTLLLSGRLAPDTYRLLTGMYDPATMDRLPVEGGPDAGGDRVLLAALTLEP